MSDHIYYCDMCGSVLEFDPKAQALKCPNCSTTMGIDNHKEDVIEHSFTVGAVKTYTVQEKTSTTMACSGCGAPIEVESDATATFCPYCGSSYVIAEKQEAAIIPDGVIPFKIDKKDANERFGVWIKKRHFAPSSLKQLYRQGKVQGRYIPFWTFDASCQATYTGMGGKRRKETYKDKDGKTQTRTVVDWYPTSGKVSHFFDDVLISGTSNFQSYLVNGMDSYNLKDVASYSPKYFSGYLSECYTIDLETAHKTAASEMDSHMRSLAGSDIRKTYDESKDVRINAKYDKETYKHIMAPLYTTSFMFKDKNYTVLINGQTGAIKGEYPKSPLKIALFILAIIALLVLLYFASNGGFSNRELPMDIQATAYEENYELSAKELPSDAQLIYGAVLSDVEV